MKQLRLPLRISYASGNCSEGCGRLAKLAGRCKRCYQRHWREINPRKVTEIQARYIKKNPGRQNIDKVKDPKILRARWRKRRGLPDPAYPEPDACECCGAKPGVLRLDHDHETGLFRGWLCNSCNIGIGSLKDTKEGVRAALKYLERSSDRNISPA